MSSTLRIIGLLAATVAGLHGCGGGGSGSGGGGSGSTPNASGWTQGVFQSFTGFAGRCASPRSGVSAVTGRAFPDVQGSVLQENNWLRSWTHHLYLWYLEVPDLNPANYSSTAEYFRLLRTPAVTPSGRPKDQYHFTYSTAEWEALSQTGVEPGGGYGLRWHIVSATQTTPARIRVAYLEPGMNSPAVQAGLTRGAEIEAVNGISLNAIFTQAQSDIVQSGVYPGAPGQTHSFRVRDRNGSVRNITMQSATTTITPVQNVRTIEDGAGRAGYLLFTDHLATAEGALIDAIQTLRQENVTDLVLDVRYNGGGYLVIASQLAYMIAGSARTAGRTFERMMFNDKHPTTNPVTGQPLQPTPFSSTTVGLSRPEGASLPALNLSRVFVLTGDDTCSASEAIINGLRGVDVEVIQIGGTTCGKPYGFYGADNCGTTYFSIQFKAVNARDFGEYPDGFSPWNTTGTAGVRVPGCSLADDFSRDLGDPAEALLAAALNYRRTLGCPAPTGLGAGERKLAQAAREAGTPDFSRPSPWRENRILR